MSLFSLKGEALAPIRSGMSRKQSAKCKQPERARLIALLGWEPEPAVAAERYCATTGELWQTAVEQCGREAADACRGTAL